MTVKMSGLWCDVCHRPILDDPYWDAKINGVVGHVCKKCKDAYEKVETNHTRSLSK